jgi:hypothetical protein
MAMRSMTMIFVLLAAAACGGKEKSAPAQPAPVAEHAPSNRVEEPPPPQQPVAMNADSTGSPECDEYLATFDRIRVNCKEQLASAAEAMDQAAAAQRDAFGQWKTLDDEGRQAAIDAAGPGCKSATDALRQAAQSMTPPCSAD